MNPKYTLTYGMAGKDNYHTIYPQIYCRKPDIFKKRRFIGFRLVLIAESP